MGFRKSTLREKEQPGKKPKQELKKVAGSTVPPPNPGHPQVRVPRQLQGGPEPPVTGGRRGTKAPRPRGGRVAGKGPLSVTPGLVLRGPERLVSVTGRVPPDQEQDQTQRLERHRASAAGRSLRPSVGAADRAAPARQGGAQEGQATWRGGGRRPDGVREGREGARGRGRQKKGGC